MEEIERRGRGKEEGRRRAERGAELVVCPRKKKEKSALMCLVIGLQKFSYSMHFF